MRIELRRNIEVFVFNYYWMDGWLRMGATLVSTIGVALYGLLVPGSRDKYLHLIVMYMCLEQHYMVHT